MLSTICSPRPAPLRLVENRGLKIDGRMFSGIPGPLSETVSSIPFSSPAAAIEIEQSLAPFARAAWAELMNRFTSARSIAELRRVSDKLRSASMEK